MCVCVCQRVCVSVWCGGKVVQEGIDIHIFTHHVRLQETLFLLVHNPQSYSLLQFGEIIGAT